jgi:hypothetical protein
MVAYRLFHLAGEDLSHKLSSSWRMFTKSVWNVVWRSRDKWAKCILHPRHTSTLHRWGKYITIPPYLTWMFENFFRSSRLLFRPKTMKPRLTSIRLLSDNYCPSLHPFHALILHAYDPSNMSPTDPKGTEWIDKMLKMKFNYSGQIQSRWIDSIVGGIRPPVLFQYTLWKVWDAIMLSSADLAQHKQLKGLKRFVHPRHH